MSEKDFNYYKSLRDKLSGDKRPDVLKLGYNLSCGIGALDDGLCLSARLQPLPESPDPIDDYLFEKIENELKNYLKENNLDVHLDLQYIGRIVAQ